MESRDIFQFTQRAVLYHRLRSLLTALGIAIGVAAVVLLTSLGEGLNQYMVGQFSQFGTNVMRVGMGKDETIGLSPGMLNTQRPLTIEDALAVGRLPDIVAAVPSRFGVSEVEANDRVRQTMVLGTSREQQDFLHLELSEGRFLPPDDPLAPRPLAVLGATIHQELFDGASPVGQKIRIAGSRFRVVGVMAAKGDVIGLNVDESVVIPAARALELYNEASLFDISIRYDPLASEAEVKASVRRLLIARHGVEDFNIQTQQQMVDTLGSVLAVITVAVAALGSISLFVGGVGIFTIMTIAVRERTQEIGLMRSLGSTRSQVQQLFLSEAIVLAALGGLMGLMLGGGVIVLIRLLVPGLPISLSIPYVIASMLVSAGIGLMAGVVPASHAARLDPLEALRAE